MRNEDCGLTVRDAVGVQMLCKFEQVIALNSFNQTCGMQMVRPQGQPLCSARAAACNFVDVFSSLCLAFTREWDVVQHVRVCRRVLVRRRRSVRADGSESKRFSAGAGMAHHHGVSVDWLVLVAVPSDAHGGGGGVCARLLPNGGAHAAGPR